MAEVGNPQSLLAPGGELVFNDFKATRTVLGGGSDLLAALPEGNGYLLQKILGGDGATIRNPVDNRPHKSGGIMHRFYRTAMIYTIEGLILATSNANRTTLTDLLLGVSDQIMQKDGRQFFTPSGMPTRFRTVRLNDPLDISDDSLGIAAPRSFTMTLVAENPLALKFTQDSTAFTSGASHTIPNDGNTATWPVIQINGPLTAATVTITNTVSGFAVELDSLTIASGHYAEINMFNETIFLDGNSTNLLSHLNLTASDFFSIAAGGESVTIAGAAGTVLSNSAWV
jgi:hypothetical protein